MPGFIGKDGNDGKPGVRGPPGVPGVDGSVGYIGNKGELGPEGNHSAIRKRHLRVTARCFDPPVSEIIHGPTFGTSMEELTACSD